MKIIMHAVSDLENFRYREPVTRIAALLVISVFFLALHMIFRPFDNRANLLLDQMESAGLWAITNTLLMKSFTIATDYTGIFAGHDARKQRDTVAVLIVLVWHANFLRIAVWGLIRPFGLSVITLLHRTRFHQCLDKAGVHNQGKFVLESGRLNVSDLTNVDRSMLSATFDELLSEIMEHNESLDFNDLTQLVEWSCTESRLMREKCERVRPRLRLTHSGSFNPYTSDQVVSLRTIAHQLVSHMWQHFRYTAIDQVETVPPEEFQDQENVEQTYGHHFTVEELQVAVMRARAGIHHRSEKRSQLISWARSGSSDLCSGRQMEIVEEVEDQRKLEQAALRIQAARRGSLGRKQVASMKDEAVLEQASMKDKADQEKARQGPEFDIVDKEGTIPQVEPMSTWIQNYHIRLEASHGIIGRVIGNAQSPPQSPKGTWSLAFSPTTPPGPSPRTPPMPVHDRVIMLERLDKSEGRGKTGKMQ